jgi:2-keto-4-pentenoate hydratase/2-oxohepta-3-ene-1,7-dioic acid hydratase in catechol pathway
LKLVTYTSGGRMGAGVALGAGVAPIVGYSSLLELVQDGESGLERARVAAASAEPVTPDRILAPLRPPKLLGGGVNYRGHEAVAPDATVPEEPFFFSKLSTAVCGTGDEIVVPYPGMLVECGVELCVVIGSTVRNAPQRRGLDFVFGYTLLNDVSGKSVASTQTNLTLNKSFDTFAPLGPAIVTTDEIPDLQGVHLTTEVSGDRRQDVVASEMHWEPAAFVEWISSFITLEPGDVISTGSPPGYGDYRDRTIVIEPGDTVTVSATAIGDLTNRVVGPTSGADPWQDVRLR